MLSFEEFVDREGSEIVKSTVNKVVKNGRSRGANGNYNTHKVPSYNGNTLSVNIQRTTTTISVGVGRRPIWARFLNERNRGAFINNYTKIVDVPS